MFKEAMIMLLILLALFCYFASGTIHIEWQDGVTPPTIQLQPTQKPENPTAPPVQTPTTPPTVTAPPATEPPAPTQAPTEAPSKTEVHYTEDELLALSHDTIVYGPGTARDGNPAPYAPGAQELYGKYDAHFIENSENVIYLTFDCGYEYYADGRSVTAMILDTLKEKGVKALFFVTGSYAEKNPDLVRRILEEGHSLGNHGANHSAMPSLDIAGMLDQILSLHHLVQDQFGYTMKFFRPPEGIFSLRSLAVTQNAGYETVHWSFAYADWDTAKQPDPAAALEKIISCHHDGAIYLLHAVSTTNAQVLGDVIDGLQALGYRLEVLS